jgi:hypothetical protein
VGGCGLSATADSSPAVFRLRPFFMLHPTMLRNILAARLLILCEMEIENMSLSGGKKPNHYDPRYAKAAFGLLLVVLVGSLVALYSGVPVAQFMTR